MHVDVTRLEHPRLCGFIPMAEIGTAQPNGNCFAFAPLQSYTTETFKFLLGTIDVLCGARHIDLCHLFGFKLGVVGQRETDIKAVEGGRHF